MKNELLEKYNSQTNKVHEETFEFMCCCANDANDCCRCCCQLYICAKCCDAMV